VNRRDLVILLGGTAAWPVWAHAQQQERVRRVGVLEPAARDDPLRRSRVDAFVQALEPLGWTIGRNLEIDVRWATGDVELLRRHATELVAAAPDVILASTNQSLALLQQATRVMQIVFVLAIDPVGAGHSR
jgi:ABC-type uncharacterized transport system substrate-binding protein